MKANHNDEIIDKIMNYYELITVTKLPVDKLIIAAMLQFHFFKEAGDLREEILDASES